MTSPSPLPSPRVRVGLIEDQSLVAEGLAAVLRRSEQAEVACIYPSASAALADQSGLRGVELLLIDYHLGDQDEFRQVRELRQLHRSLRYVWLSGAVSTAALLKMESLRFHGFVHKDDPAHHLLDAIGAVSQGGLYQSPTARRLLQELNDAAISVPKVLSDREQEVLALVGQGRTNEEIACRLGLSPSTAQTHRRNIMGKLGLRTTAALQAYAQQNGFASARFNPGP